MEKMKDGYDAKPMKSPNLAGLVMGRGWEEAKIIRVGLVLEKEFPRQLPPNHVDIMGQLQ